MNEETKALGALVKIHQALDYKEWSSDTTAEIAEIMELAGYKIHEPHDDRLYWGGRGPGPKYAAEQVEDHIRIAVWFEDKERFGVQIFNQALPAGDPKSFTYIGLKRVPEGDESLDDLLDKAIDKWEGIREA